MAQNSYHPAMVAVGPDGSVWFDSTQGNGLARMRPDGTLTTYPIESGESFTIDSHGNAWIPVSAGRKIVRISDAGGVTEFSFSPYTQQLAEGSDGRMWFLGIGCAREKEIGWTDASGHTRLLASPFADGSAYPDFLVRAPDGALWFSTVDGRLVRLASDTSVTVYSLPWPDATVGRFLVLPGNRIVMESWTIAFGHLEILDFTAANGILVAGVSSIPGPSAHHSKDAAEAAAYSGATAAYSTAAPASSTNAKIELVRFWEGDHAALFEYNINQNRCDPSFIYAYVVEDSSGWHRYDAIPLLGSYTLPEPKGVLFLKFQTGCVNVHQSPSLGSQIVKCLPSGTSVVIDRLPVYADGDIWWHVVSNDGSHSPLGWGVQKYLVCSDYLIGRLPQC